MALCSGQKFDPYKDNDSCLNYQELPPINTQLPESNPEFLPLLTILELPSISKTFLVWSPIPPFQELYLSEVSSIQKVSTPNMEHQQQIIHDLYRYSYNSFLPTFIMCNDPFSACSYGQWQIFRHAILTDEH